MVTLSGVHDASVRASFQCTLVVCALRVCSCMLSSAGVTLRLSQAVNEVQPLDVHPSSQFYLLSLILKNCIRGFYNLYNKYVFSNSTIKHHCPPRAKFVTNL